MRVVEEDGSIIYVGYIYRHWIINEDGIEVSYVGKTECKPTKRFGIGGKSKYAGKHPETKEPLHWMYYDEYLKLEEKDDNENGKY